MPKPVGVVCYICGREFGSRSIGIHEPQCIKKWENVNSKLPKKNRQPRPVKPVDFDEPFSNDPNVKAEQIAKMNLASNVAASGNLASCRNCSRTFLPDRIEHHEEICGKLKMGPATALQSGSGYYGQRIVVVDGQQVDAIAIKRENTFSTNTIVKKASTANQPAKPGQNMATNILQNKVSEQINKNVMMKGPLRTLPCQFCGKAISHNAINIHIKKCRSRSEAPSQTQTPSAETCAFCNKQFPSNVISIHARNCSSVPKVLSASHGPSENTVVKNVPKLVKPSPKQQTSKLRQSDLLPTRKAGKKGDSPPSSARDGPFSRYNGSTPSGGLKAVSSERLSTSLEESSDSNLGTSYIEVDLVVGVDPGLVLNCMICGLLVLKSKLNSHYHNFCQKSNLNRSITMPGGSPIKPTQPTPPITPQGSLVTCEVCNRSFKSSVIEEHEIQCALKNQGDLQGSMKNPDFVSVRENTVTDGAANSYKTNGLSSPTQVIGTVVTGKFVPCVNCGKSFTIRSLVIHQKQCMQ